MLQHVRDSWQIFPSTIKRLLMNTKNLDFVYHILNKLFLQFLPLCERWFWSKLKMEEMSMRKRKNDDCFQNIFVKPPLSLYCKELDKENFKTSF